jgi:hypothetical protein
LEHAVAELVAERVVDRLEVIKVDDHHRHAGLCVVCRCQRVGHALDQQPAVRQAGE